MSANAAARRLAMNAKEMASTRHIATRIRAPPTVPFIGLVQDVERSSLANLFQSKPPSGWRKSIVNSSYFSASAMSNDETSGESVLAMEDENIGKTGYSPSVQQLPLQVDMEELRALASQRCTPLKLADMYKYAVDFSDQKQRLSNAQFLHRELPIRIAQRAIDLLTLPHGLSEAAPIQQVAHYYLQYLVLFQEFPVPTTADGEERFTTLLQSMVLDRTSIPNAVAQGVSTWVASNERTEGYLAIDRLQEMEDALYRFFTARVGLRFLTEHHILSAPKRMQNASHQQLKEAQSPYNDLQKDDDKNFFLGCIQTDCCPAKEVRKVADEVARQTKEHFGMCPAIEIVDATRSNKNVNFTYVPHHLHYMVGELIKNSCRATVRKHRDSGAPPSEMPSIRVVVVKGAEDVTIKVADRGGGIPRSYLPKIWKFAHSTACDAEQHTQFGVDEVTGTKIRGFGLPLSRIYARYFGGELTLKSMEGYGLDAYLHLPRLGDACENLPIRVSHSPGERVSLPPRKQKLVDPTASRDGNARKFSTAPTTTATTPREELVESGGSADSDAVTWEDKTRRILKILQQRAL